MADILVVDDDYEIRLGVSRLLKIAGHEVREAFDGQEGIDLYRECPADLIILDIMLPRKNGLEVIQELQADYPHVKIVTISGADQVGQVNLLPDSIRLGALRAIPKPFNPKYLLEVVNELLET
ncbi:MAG: response regulator [Candidatus Latescibacteria bacterium]|jgi:two-component system chemotaxis response regulator CheY|nr:response regulator [Candidatus Latescibacterota bacterium]